MTPSVFTWLQFGLGLLGVLLLGLLFVFFIVVACIPLALRAKKKMGEDVKVNIKKINDIYEKYKTDLLTAVLSEKEKKKFLKDKKAAQKSEHNNTNGGEKKRVFVIDFKGDMAASQVTYLREHVTTVLQIAKTTDEVVIRLESPGGLVHTYGLAASQMARIRDKNIPLTVCVDKVAASGGYMMACLANKIIAAPFAILGSIGVVASIPNFNKLLKKHDVDYFEVTAGKYKRTLTPFGEPTQEKIDKSIEKVQEIHTLFKTHVKQYRDCVDIENISTGDYWFGHQAIELKLVDSIQTSDDYLLDLSHQYNLFLIYSPHASNLREKIFSGFSNIWYTFFNH
jgi:serine protease SohB